MKSTRAGTEKSVAGPSLNFDGSSQIESISLDGELEGLKNGLCELPDSVNPNTIANQVATYKKKTNFFKQFMK